ncbi:zinc-ribbon domain-containing protein [Pendulispora rubella]|uniref:Zinc-ribbon domain-containing protein n=1 Tax=Pendulispora rubella TaxID=2741070 RepID=A0ABZ2KUU5_9BACT
MSTRVVADFPRLVAEWHKTRNHHLTPAQVGAGSDKYIWWRCPNGRDHVWQATPWKRAYGEQGCPYCAGKKVSATNSLAKQFPKVAKQWHPTKNLPLTPNEVVGTSCRRVWWKCPNGPDHEWQTKVEDRTRRENGCPYCRGRRVSVTNCFAIVAPKIAREWHPTKNGKITPDRVSAQSWSKRWWKCPKGRDHVWQAPIGHRVSHQTGCPMCSRRFLSESTTLKADAPQFARYWHPTKNGKLRPSDVSSVSRHKVWWKCPKGPDHEWLCAVASRVRAKNGCPFCGGRKLSVTNSLHAKYPRVASEWHPTKNRPVTPKDILPGTGRRFWWRCVLGHEWRAFVTNRTTHGSGCPTCAPRGRRPALTAIRREVVRFPSDY